MFDRLEKLIGTDNLNLIKTKKILIVGLGGVGSYAVETLARNGIENMILIDNDTIEESNKNRQLIALDSTINKYKTDVFYDRLKDINKNINIITIKKFIDKNNIEEIFKYDIDYIIDACDTITTKILLIEESVKHNIKIISSMGMGNKFDISKIKICDIKNTSYDKIAKIIRKRLKDDGINQKIICVSSTEKAKITHNRKPYSYSPVPNTCGIIIADYIIKDILKKD